MNQVIIRPPAEIQKRLDILYKDVRETEQRKKACRKSGDTDSVAMLDEALSMTHREISTLKWVLFPPINDSVLADWQTE